MTPLTKRLAVALAISIAFNLLLAGFWIGRALDRRQHRQFARELSGAQGPGRGMRSQAFRELIEHGRSDFRAQREATRAARASIRAALEKEPFDRQKLEQSLAALRSATHQGQEALHSALADAAEKGGPDVRRQLSQAFSGDRRRRR